VSWSTATACCATDARGAFRFHTVKPGCVPFPDGRLQAPHIAVSVMARGMLKRMATRLYFADEPANADDPVLALVPAARRATLLATPVSDSPGTYRFDIVSQGTWQGRGETVFFDV
jgi:protocatechuate 3,4-dioxygenase, alpha subunit